LSSRAKAADTAGSVDPNKFSFCGFSASLAPRGRSHGITRTSGWGGVELHDPSDSLGMTKRGWFDDGTRNVCPKSARLLGRRGTAFSIDKPPSLSTARLLWRNQKSHTFRIRFCAEVLTKNIPKQVSAYGGSPWAKFSSLSKLDFRLAIWTAPERAGEERFSSTPRQTLGKIRLQPNRATSPVSLYARTRCR